MIFKTVVCCGAVLIAPCLAQQSQLPQSPSAVPTTPSLSPVEPVLQQLQQAAQGTRTDVSALRIEKWKADGNTKQQAQQMAESVSRNLAAGP